MKARRLLIPTTSQTYYIVFDSHRGANTNWWHYILDKDYMHCFLLAKISDTQTMLINPLHWGICNIVINEKIEKVIESYLSVGVTSILEYTTKVNKREKFKFRGVYTCVSLVKAVLNIRGMSLSPKRLHRYLLQHGARKIKGV